jgi:hypothetical protein
LVKPQGQDIADSEGKREELGPMGSKKQLLLGYEIQEQK